MMNTAAMERGLFIEAGLVSAICFLIGISTCEVWAVPHGEPRDPTTLTDWARGGKTTKSVNQSDTVVFGFSTITLHLHLIKVELVHGSELHENILFSLQCYNG